MTLHESGRSRAPWHRALRRRRPLLALPFLTIVTALFASGCRFSGLHHSHPHERLVHIALGDDDARHLAIEGDLADVVVHGGALQPHAIVVVREKRPLAGQVRLAALEPEDGPFSARLDYACDGDDGYIDRIELWLPREVESLNVTTALGDVEIVDVAVADELRVLVDLGDVSLARVSAGSGIDVRTGLGDLVLVDLAGALFATTDLGDVRVERIDAPTATITTDLGDLELVACRVSGPFEFGTELGDTNVDEAGFYAPVNAPAAASAESVVH